MTRNFGIIIILLALLPIILYFFLPSNTVEFDQLSLSENEKNSLVDYSYFLLDSYFGKTNGQYELEYSSKVEYNILFITLLNNGSVRGCQSGSTSYSDENRLFSDIKEAVIESINDDRFGGIIAKDELNDIEIMFTFLYNVTWLNNHSLSFLENNIELGVHAIELFHNNTPTIFKESVPISNNYDFPYLMERLCLKAGLDDACLEEDSVELYRYDTLTFMRPRNEPVVDLYRYNILIDEDDIDQELIYHRLESAYDWFIHTVNQTSNTLEYLYYPSVDLYSDENNHVRQLATLWALTELDTFLSNKSLDPVIHSTLEYYLSLKNSSENISFLSIDGEAKLANNAFMILSLLNLESYENKTELIDDFASGILSLQNENGSFDTYFFSDKNTGIDYYPGEAMLALMKLYEKSNDNIYLNSVHDAFYYYRSYWRNHTTTAFIPWHTQTYKILFEQTKNPEIASFIFEMNDWLIDNYQIKNSEYVDEIGGFPKYFPTFSTSVFIEGLNDAYVVSQMMNDSIHIKKYEEAIRLGTRYMLQTQFTEKNTFYLENKVRSIGGFRTSLTSNSIRIDNTQHAVMGLMKTFNNNIFT